MSTSLRVLLLEDQPFDAELIVYQLRRAGYSVDWRRVDTEADYLEYLVTRPDLILADYNLPRFNALKALHLLQQSELDIPFIVVTGSIEEAAIECMKQGAVDYLLKDRLGRLGQAVERAMEQKALRQEKRRAEQSLRESERAMATLLSNLPGIAYRCLADPQRSMHFISNGCIALTGYQPDEILDNRAISYMDLIHPLDRDMVQNEIQSALRHSQPYQMVYRIQTKSKEERWFWEQGQVISALPGAEMQTLEGLILDITPRFRAEEALRENEELFRQLAENVHEVFWVQDVETRRIIYISPVYETIWGRSRSQIYEQPDSLLSSVHPDDTGRTMVANIRLAQGIPMQEEFRIIRPDGHIRWVAARTYPVFNSELLIYRWVGVAEDITERKEADEALRESAQFNRAIVSSAGEGIVVFDRELRYLVWNKFMENITGIRDTDLLGKKALGITHVFHHPGMEELLDRALQGEFVSSEDTMMELGGNDRSLWVSNTYGPYRNSRGEIVGIVGIVRDITQRKQMEEQLRQQTQRIRALDTASQVLNEIGRDYLGTLETIARHTAELLKDGCGIFMLSKDGQWLQCVALHHPVEARMSILQGLFSMIPAQNPRAVEVLSGRPFFVDEASQDSLGVISPKAKQLLDQLRGSRVVGVPLRAQGRVIGALAVIREHERPTYTQEDQNFLQELADRMALAVTNTRLYNENLRRLEYVQALREIDMAITGNSNLGVILNVVLDKISARLHMDAASILVYRPHLQTLDYISGSGFHSRSAAHRSVRLGEGLAGRVALERRPIFIANMASDGSEWMQSTPFFVSEGVVAYYAAPLLSKGQVQGVLELFHRSEIHPDDEWYEFVQSLAGQAAIAIDNNNMFEALQRSHNELILAYDDTIEGWSRALDLRDKETEGHTQRVTEMTVRLARSMGISDADIVHIRRGALLHDIGKMGVPDAILLKPAQLNDEELINMRRHPQHAYDMLEKIAYLRPALDIPYCHHEWWDGSGYPRGLDGEQIPLAARIFAVIDVWDAITTDRVYHMAWSRSDALAYIQSLVGKQFDPQVVDAFVREFREEIGV